MLPEALEEAFPQGCRRNREAGSHSFVPPSSRKSRGVIECFVQFFIQFVKFFAGIPSCVAITT